MAGTSDRMTFEELTSIYSVELRSNALSEVRKDLYPAMIALFKEQVSKCDALASKDPDSIMFDGAVSRKKNIQKYMKMVTELRMKKIADMAVRSAMGATNNPVQLLTVEERRFHDGTMETAAMHWSIVDKRTRAVVPDITAAAAPAPIPEEEPEISEEIPAEEPFVLHSETVPGTPQESPREETVVIRIL
ncbi:MAG: hypothetical protein PHX75_04145, partial [Candidatus Methanomethylophilaceae archaeon]|nr:hypothetical protein [Candidatus Methanomethylophilaceae archaeon]